MVAGAKLLILDNQTIINVLNIATSKASGIRANFGFLTKAYHARMSYLGSFEALNLAKFGLESSSDSFKKIRDFCKFMLELSPKLTKFRSKFKLFLGNASKSTYFQTISVL
ncbi:MAG: hypothetical protein MR902_03755 [Campylobacter sp.]|nr:hypothetical protein [Campylobacter sp.]